MLPNNYPRAVENDDIDQNKLDILFTEFKIIMKTVRELSDKEFKAFNKRIMARG